MDADVDVGDEASTDAAPTRARALARTLDRDREHSGAACGDFAECAKKRYGKFVNSTYGLQVYA